MFTKPFIELSKDDAVIAGGKGASLGEMTQAGIPVPTGFVVLTTAFERFLEETDLLHEVDTILHSVKHEEIHTVEAASEKIQGLIKSVRMPKDIAEEITKQFLKLGAQFVAVRSSATSEDGKEAAWAGQLDSYLNTREDDLLGRVQDCFASLFTPRAIFYRFEKGLHTTKISVAVVIQKMIESEVSGIAFSVHPVTEDYNQIIIEAGFGLGEAIVSGQITPDSYVVEKNPRRIIDKNISVQERGLYKKTEGGNEWRPIPSGEKQKLSDEEVLRLSELVLTIEKHYGFPCDIEWAYEMGEFYIVQSRPITTLQKKTAGYVSETGKYKYFGFWPTSPLAAWFWIDWDKTNYLKLMGLEHLVGSSVFAQGGHYMVTSNTFTELTDFIKKQIKEDTDFFARFKFHSNVVFEEYNLTSKRLNWNPVSLIEFEDLISKIYPIMSFWVIGHLISESLQIILDDFVSTNKDSGFKTEMLHPSSKTALESYFDIIRNLRISLERALGPDLNKNIILQTLAGDEYSKEVAHILENYIWIRSFKFLNHPLTVDDIVGDILDLDGKKTTGKSIEITNRSLLKIVKAYNDVAYSRNAAAEWFSRFSFNTSMFLQKVSRSLGIDEESLHLLTPQEIGVAFYNKEEYLQKIENRADNNWLLYKEAKRISINDSRDEIADFYRREIKPHLETFALKEGLVQGQSANGGQVKGAVRVILNQSDFSKFADGDVLVTTMTTPDFVVLMKRASAIVTDIGGLLTHAAIVSRELNIPCIIGTKIATQVLKDGDLVEVDATSGKITILM